MTKRYAIRAELDDGTLMEPSSYLSNKSTALYAARKISKSTLAPDVVRIWVDDTRTDLGVKSFEVAR